MAAVHHVDITRLAVAVGGGVVHQVHARKTDEGASQSSGLNVDDLAIGAHAAQRIGYVSRGGGDVLRFLGVQQVGIAGIDVLFRLKQVRAFQADVREFYRRGGVHLPGKCEVPVLHIGRVIVGRYRKTEAPNVQTAVGRAVVQKAA